MKINKTLHQWGCHLYFSIYSAPTKAIRKLLLKRIIMPKKTDQSRIQ